MEHFKSYEIKKSKLLEKIEKLKQGIYQLKEIGFETEDSIKKLEETVNAVKNNKLSIALVGSFSDGKTSVIAGWLGEKLDNMKINSDESSDQLEIYTPKSLPEKCEIIDTPGLFGDKEKEDESGKNIKFSDVTKKYIDQANIILYVVEAKNPLKDSHSEVVRWIMKDLNKLENTIFVINKMDTVTDLTDDEAFKKTSNIKCETLRDKITKIPELSSIDSQKINIVCISSNPDDKGFEFWAEHKDAYEKRSRIRDLENKTNDILQNISSAELSTKTGFDTVGRVISEYINEVESQFQLIIEKILPELRSNLECNREEFEQAKNRILSKQNNFIQEIVNLREDLKNELKTYSSENIEEFIRDKIGIENKKMTGKYIIQKINSIMQKYFDYSSNIINNLKKDYEKIEKKQDDFFNSFLGKKALLAIEQGVKEIASTPLRSLRDNLKTTQNIFGTKFSKKQIDKTANLFSKTFKKLEKTLPTLIVGMEVLSETIETVKKIEDNKKFNELKDDLCDIIEEICDDIIEKAQGDKKDFLELVAPQLIDLLDDLDNQQKIINEQQEKSEFFQKWKKQVIEILES